MDDRRFDAFVRALATGQNRRSMLKGLLGLGGVAAIGASQMAPDAEAARRPAPTATPPRCPGMQIWKNSACVCPDEYTNCGPDCCPIGEAECCDNACCYGDCYGEELCCPTGQIVCNGTCCPSESQCCTVGGTSFCSPDDVTCCAGDGDCAGLDRCDGLTAHHFTCVNSICTDSSQNCQGTDVCTTYSCSAGVCGSAPIAGCCRSDSECRKVDDCTPAQCLSDHTCNALSMCTTEEQCCSGICASTLDRCCTSDTECSDLDFCSEFSPDAYHYSCVNYVCTRETEDCTGSDPCISYGCLDGACTETPLSGCCAIDGIGFPPCVTGCPTCLTPNGQSVPCACAQLTSQSCTSTADCKTISVDAVCVGPPGSSVCAVPYDPSA